MRRFFGLLLLSVFVFCSMTSAASAKMSFKVSNQFPPSHNISKGLLVFAEKLKEHSNGEITAELFDSAQLFKDSEILEALQDNLVECGISTAVRWSGMVPEINILESPFLFKNFESIARFFESEGGKILEAEFEKRGIKNIAWLDNGFNQMFNNKRPLRVPEDFKGVTMRSFGSGDAETLKALGAGPTVMSSSEMYMALQRGTMDGATTTMDAAVSRKIIEVIKYATESNYSVSQIVLQVNKDWWDSLPQETREVISKAAKDTEIWVRNAIKTADDAAREKILAAGIEIYVPTEEDRKLLKEATESVRADFVKSTGELGRKLVEIAMGLN